MYLAYSILVTSLVPTIATTGRLKSYTSLFNDAKKRSTLEASDNYVTFLKQAQVPQ